MKYNHSYGLNAVNIQRMLNNNYKRIKLMTFAKRNRKIPIPPNWSIASANPKCVFVNFKMSFRAKIRKYII